MKMHQTLSDLLDTDYKEEPKELVPVEKKVEEDPDLKEDFEHVRTVLKDLVETGTVAIGDMHAIAQNTEEARSFEVLATLIKNVSETAEKILTAHEKKKKVLQEGTFQKVDPRREAPGFNIDKAVFVGTSTELLTRLEEEDKNE